MRLNIKFLNENTNTNNVSYPPLPFASLISGSAFHDKPTIRHPPPAHQQPRPDVAALQPQAKTSKTNTHQAALVSRYRLRELEEFRSKASTQSIARVIDASDPHIGSRALFIYPKSHDPSQFSMGNTVMRTALCPFLGIPLSNTRPGTLDLAPLYPSGTRCECTPRPELDPHAYHLHSCGKQGAPTALHNAIRKVVRSIASIVMFFIVNW